MRRALSLCTILAGTVLELAAQTVPVNLDLRESREGRVVAVVGCNPETLASLQETGTDWSSVLTVRVAAAPAEAPAILGRYLVEKDALVFVPRFPLATDVEFEVRFQDTVNLGCGGSFLTILGSAGTAEPPTTRVVRVEPTAAQLPENQLKLYLFFSAPMSRGYAYRHIALLNEEGARIELPFLEIEQELWDRDGSRLTLLFDPGRVKRELLPNREVGPPLVEGRRYTLRVDPGWPDATGRPLAAAFEKVFEVGPPDRRSPDPGRWTLGLPDAGTVEPLEITFDEPLDGGLLRRQLGVIAPGGATLTGTIELRNHETTWLFRPDRPWESGSYELLIGTTLEDLAGNSIGRTFEVDLFEKVEARVTSETVGLTFQIRPGSD